VLKGGVIVGEEQLVDGKGCHIIGRLAGGAVDILMEHPFISRQHAALVYGVRPPSSTASVEDCRGEAEMYIVDLGSTHGTYVNKVKIGTPLQYRRLYVGDVIKIGASSRLLIVKGPEAHAPPEYDSANLRRLREMSEEKTALSKSKKKSGSGEEEQEDAGATWGFDADAQDEDEEGGEGQLSDEEDLPDYLKTEEQREKAQRKKAAGLLTEK
jgi:hypothetical protein